MTLREATLALTYSHELADTWSLYALCCNEGVIAPEDLHLAGWFRALGGLQIYVGRFLRVADTTGRADVFSHAWFLAETTVALREATPLREVVPTRPPHDATLAELRLEDGGTLQLRQGEGELLLDHLDPHGGAPEDRLSPYFVGLKLDPDAWVDAAYVALEEWARITRRRAPAHPPEDHLGWRLVGAIGRATSLSGRAHSKVHS